MENAGRRTKVAILGGGVAAMSAAFELTSAPDWKDRYEVTVYQMGWRLGGKGASGRNAAVCQRIEEHGLHFWLGFYENAFRMIRQCYAENARPLTEALATWTEAFKPCWEVNVEDHVDDTWIPWLLSFAPNPDVPGDTTRLPSLWEMAGTAVEFLRNLLVKAPIAAAAGSEHEGFRARVEGFLSQTGIRPTQSANSSGEALLHVAKAHVDATAARNGHCDPAAHTLLGSMIETYWQWIVQHVHGGQAPAPISAGDEELRRFLIMTEFVVVNLRGIIADGVLVRGLSSIDEYDYVEWLTRHGASPEVSTCGLVRAFYDLCFSPYATVAAGTYLRGMLRILFTYRGGVYWRMQAGMGDTIFAPLYEVLRRRGVRFRFFHKVTALHTDEDKRSIASIEMGRQATLKTDEYEPLVRVRRLPCWPSEPLYEQLQEGEELRRRKINLESWWTDWQDVEQLTLVRGVDFDQVVFGISLGSVPLLCPDLIAARPEWQAMVRQVQTTATQAIQVWYLPDMAGLRWPYWQKESPLVAGFTEPMDTFANMDHLLIREDWPASAAPTSIAYFCGPMPGVPLPPASDHGFPAQQAQAAYQTALQFMNQSCAALLPGSAAGEGQCDYSLLADVAEGTGESRFQAQFFRANVDPSERYVMSVKGSPRYRLHAAASGFDNLFLAGDWTDNGVNAGCVEAAVISGLQAAAGILQRPSTAIGEHFGETCNGTRVP
ncbi:MAG: FAD-dependent oxidoreductase [Acidobacteriaceae bacterium]